jgi:hypothetical protein
MPHDADSILSGMNVLAVVLAFISAVLAAYVPTPAQWKDVRRDNVWIGFVPLLGASVLFGACWYIRLVRIGIGELAKSNVPDLPILALPLAIGLGIWVGGFLRSSRLGSEKFVQQQPPVGGMNADPTS